MSSPTKFWLAVGRHINWLTAFERGYVWGLKTTQRRYWEALTEHSDIVFFYVTVPVGGVVGYGLVRTKLVQNSPHWAEEIFRNEVIWPLRFEFDVLSAIPPDRWREERVILEELKVRARGGFQELDCELAAQLVRTLPGRVSQELVAPTRVLAPTESLSFEALPLSQNLHERAQYQLVEIGRIQKFIADREFPLENRRVDVVWRRVQRSVPGHVFEVHVGGNLTEAMAKLKQARDQWNSNIFLVSQEDHRTPVNQLLSGSFHEIQDRMRFVEIGQVEELYKRKRAYRELENQLGILV